MSSGFISETDIVKKRKLRQELWDQSKKEGDPDEPPEEEEKIVDHRSLYERLQEQKDKKQLDYDESHKLKNMIRGLEDDEVNFLDFVDNTKMEQERKIKEEEKFALEEYRKKVSEIQQKAAETEIKTELKTEQKKPVAGKRSSQSALLSTAIKRKSRDDSSDSSPDSKKRNTNKNPLVSGTFSNTIPKSNLECVAILPGLGVYTDSSDSETGSDSDFEVSAAGSFPRDLTGRIIHLQSSDGHGCC